MGFLRQLFGTKKPISNSSSAASPPLSDPKPKKRWGFARSRQDKTRHASQPHPGAYDGDNLDANKHAIAVAAATAAVAEAALAAAQAAAEVVRLTNRGGGGGGGRVRGAGRAHAGGTRRWAEIVAAVKIQSAFRGYLARRALRALKALVKLQAVVRGHIVRKQTADMLKRMQTLVRVQARARATRSNVSESLHFSCKTAPPHHPVPASPDKNELRLRAYSTKFDESSILKRCGSNSELLDISGVDQARSGSNWLNHWMEENLWNNSRDIAIRSGHADDEKSDKILEVDTWKPRLNSQPSHKTSQSSQHYWSPGYNKQNCLPYDSPSKYSAKGHNPMPSVSSGEAVSFSSFKYPVGVDEVALRTAENSPQVYSTSSRPGSSSARRGPFTPARSECSWGYFNGYSDHPNYMANTESFRAKVRSQSAPRQRLEFDRYGQNKRSAQGSWDAGTNSEKSYTQHGEPKNKAYPISSSLSRNRSAKLR